MKKFLFVFLLTLMTGTIANAQSMSDEAVMEYVKSGVKQGKTQKQLYQELLIKGVTKEQLLRIKEKYEQQQSEAKTINGKDNVDTQRVNPEQRDDTANAQDDNKAEAAPEGGIKVFGRDIFRNSNLTFEPSMNIATPVNYRLGPGDQIVIEVWGASEANITQKVSPDGYISIPDIGPVSVNGLTVQAASERIRGKLSKIYSGMASSNVDLSTNVKVSLGQIRTIQVNIMGEVARPGTYALSSFSTVFHALYKAGGISQLGSLRNIKVVRGGRTVATVDVYDYIINGRSHSDIRLQEGDVILASPYDALVLIQGKIKRPMYYEMKRTESIRTLINYAGGFTNDAYSSAVTVERNNAKEKTICTVDDMNYGVFKVRDGDVISVGAILDRYDNRVEIKGAVYRPGFYAMGKEISTVRDLIQKADGLLDDAFTNRGVLHRENPDKTLEVLSVNIKGILNGTEADITLQKNDVLFIPSIYDLESKGTLEIIGEVYSPGIFPYASNTKLEDLIIMAGGLTEAASTVRVDVTRRFTDPKSTKKTKDISKTYTFSVKDGFVVEGEPGFVLEPYDQVFVRRSPGYAQKINVTINGEVEFEGNYALNVRNERLSDIIKQAGGLTEFAYLEGARLERQLTYEEYLQAKELMAMVTSNNKVEGNDSIVVPEVTRTYPVGIDLVEIMKNPHTDIDPVLHDGDVIIIPQLMTTVSISGSVRKPNSVVYNPKMKLKDYISEAGGYAERARKSGTFILYPNGHIKELGRSASAKEIIGGSKIIVPQKAKSQWNIGTTLSTVTTSVSMLAVIASLINTLK
ncbi:MAG: SLBB domain-containing protein [Prevotella sp.]|nr:SLBB domain-containing protein [Prevotella sp.]MDD5895651.1 SLBB domain-containing protein [Prevotellaceae bacterium]